MLDIGEFPVDLSPKFVEKVKHLNINVEDITEKFVRGGGKGGQKINKTSSCVTLKHEPTGIEIRCQKYREQSKNRLSAYKLLILKIEDKVKGVKSERAQKIFKLRKQKKRRSKKAKEKMLEIKKQRSEIKQTRKEIKQNE